MPQHIRICALNELAPGSRRVVEINAVEEALVVHHNGHIFAISNICPHEGAALQHGLIEDNIIYCPLHQWGFDLSTGVYIEAISRHRKRVHGSIRSRCEIAIYTFVSDPTKHRDRHLMGC